MAETIAFLSARGIPVCAHVGLTPQAVNALGGYGARGKSEAEAEKSVRDARAVDAAGCFLLVIEGVMEEIADKEPEAVAWPSTEARGVGKGGVSTGRTRRRSDN